MKTDPFIEFLRSEFNIKKSRKEGYSLRSYSRYLGVDSSNLSKILKYQKSLGVLLRKKLGEKLGLDEQEIIALSSGSTWALQTQDKSYNLHNAKIFEIASGWQHYAILELFKIPGFRGDPKSIVRMLDISVEKAQQSLANLKKTNLLVKSKDGTWQPAEDSSSSILTTPTSAAHRRQQREILEGAISALETTPVELRSQTSITLAIDVKKLEKARELIKKFRRELGRFLSDSENRSEVYQLSISLYPVTNKTKTKEII